MKEIVAILAIVGLLVFGAFAVASTLDSAAQGWAQGQAHQAYATVTVAQIEAQTQIRLQELRMLENAYTRSLFAAMFWPAAALVGLLMAAGVWLAVWREDRRQRAGYYYQRYEQLPGDWRPAITARRDGYSRFEWDTLQAERDYWERQR